MYIGESKLEIQARTGCEKKKTITSVDQSFQLGDLYEITAVSNGSYHALYFEGTLMTETIDDGDNRWTAWSEGSVGFYCWRCDCAITSFAVESLTSDDASRDVVT